MRIRKHGVNKFRGRRVTLVKEVKSPTIQEILFSESITDKICLNLSLSRFLSGGLYITPIIVFLFFSL